MNVAPEGAAELLERALAYTRGTLLHVTPAALRNRTPCADWDLDDLLAHMDDALDAFTEAADGTIDVDRTSPLTARVTGLQVKACGLLGAWSGPTAPASVRLGDLRLPTEVVVLAAALEIAVHGWDVGQATGHAAPIPDALARALRPVADGLVADADRGVHFADPLGSGPDAAPGTDLLAFLGRRPLVHRTERRSAS